MTLNSFFEQFKVAHRLGLLALTAFLAFGAITIESLGSLNEVLRSEREAKIRQLVETAASTLAYFQSLEAGGKLSREGAQDAAKSAIRKLRYDKDEYFWLNDMQPRMVMHPTKPELDGKDLSEIKDPQGKLLFLAMIEVVRRDQAGYVQYMWPKPGSDQPQPKLSYVKIFEPWGWIVGTGVYMSDVDAAFRQHGTHAAILALVGVLFLGLATLLTARSIVRQLGGEPYEVMAAASRVAEGDLVTTVAVRPGDRHSVLSAMAGMRDGLIAIVHGIHANAQVIVATADRAAQVADTVREASARQAEAAASTAATVEEMTVSLNHVADNTVDSRTDAQRTAEMASEGAERARQASAGIGQISCAVDSAARQIEVLRAKSVQIGAIAGVIGDIASQTNLLALNAAIEAARAGEQGRGFAVVADEVRKLSERTTEATARISEVVGSVQAETESAVASIHRISPDVEQGGALSRGAAESLQSIEHGSREALVRIEDVTNSMRELGSASNAMAGHVQDIADMADRNGQNAQAAAEAAAVLNASAQTLTQSVARFRVPA